MDWLDVQVASAAARSWTGEGEEKERCMGNMAKPSREESGNLARLHKASRPRPGKSNINYRL